jgi:hypothetical protein
VRPHIAELRDRFAIGTIYTRPGHSPREGLAADFMTYTNTAKGRALADYVVANARRLDVQYVCWQSRIWINGSWRNDPCRGNHNDHPHVTFFPA